MSDWEDYVIKSPIPVVLDFYAKFIYFNNYLINKFN
jgi:hypothetical protein